MPQRPLSSQLKPIVAAFILPSANLLLLAARNLLLVGSRLYQKFCHGLSITRPVLREWVALCVAEG